MAEADLSKIVSLIMENPKIIEEIRGLSEKADIKEAKEFEERTAPAEIRRVENESATKRKALLSAIKPYVSKERGQAIDSMISIAEILDMMRAK